MRSILKKIYDWLIYDLLWDMSHNVKWDLFFHLIVIILQLIILIFLYKIMLK
jgi:hypothetical protein